MSKSPQGAESATPPATALRKQAEEIFRKKAALLPENPVAMSPEETRQTLHELRVHQIELEIQNEELRRAQAELDAARTRYFDLYDQAPVGYCTLSEQGLILETNLTAAGLLGVTRIALVKKPISKFILKEDQDIYYLHRKQLFETGEPQACELRMVKKDGTIFSARLEATAAQDSSTNSEQAADGATVCRVVLSDITERKQTETKLRYLSMHDALTGLYNRGYFEESMERLERGRQFPVSILMANVGSLKIFNDRHGYAAGDSLLKSVAHLLTVSFRAEDVIARLGGDEFAVLMPGTTAAAAEGALLRFRHILQEHNAACPEIPLRLSCGIGTSETRVPLIETLKKADANMYLEKQGRNVASKLDHPAKEASLSSRSEQTLRERAEEAAQKNTVQSPKNLGALSPEETRQTLHELRVHQIELEMQNEELRRAQAELEDAWARYFDLYNLAPVGYVTLSEQGLVLETNLTAAGLLGVPRVALIKQSLALFIIKEDQDTYYLYRKQLFKSGEPQSCPWEQARAACELRMKKKDGTIFWARLEAAAAEDENGTPMCHVVLSDISERKRAEDQVHQLQKTESLGRMAGAIAHHFNNQLGVVMGNLELALIGLSEDSGSRNNLMDAIKATRRSSEVSSLMLTYLGQTISQQEPLALSEVCSRNLPMLQDALPKNVVLATDLPSPGPIINANANQIQQVLTNLVTNAWEAMGEVGGAIHVTVKTVPPDDIPALHRFPIGWQPQDKDHACLEVRDTGCGIAEKDIEKLFDPFFSSKFTGRGLGLSVVLGIVRAHEGAITLESKPGRGSVFRIFMLLSKEEVSWRPERAGSEKYEKNLSR